MFSILYQDTLRLPKKIFYNLLINLISCFDWMNNEVFSTSLIKEQLDKESINYYKTSIRFNMSTEYLNIFNCNL